MRKPTKFKSGCYNWQIYWSQEEAEEMYGKTDTHTKTITIYKCKNDEITRETLLHELLHVVMEDKAEAVFNFDPDKKEYDKERTHQTNIPVLMQLIIDNPELWQFQARLKKMSKISQNMT